MSQTAVSLFRERARRYADRPALRALRAGGAPADEVVTWAEWGRAVEQTAASLVAGGHGAREVAAVLAGNRPLWPIADLGILSAGLISAGIYPSSAPAQVRQILADSGATIVFVDSAAQLAKVLQVADRLPRLRTIVAEAPAAGTGPAVQPERPTVVGWREWLARGAEALRDPGVAEQIEQRARALAPDDTAVLIYTSGSTGEPKGARIPHRYLLASAESIRHTLSLTDADTTLSFLPFCHAGERVFGLYTRILCGMETGLVEDHTRLWDAARDYGPTVFGGLPRFFEKLFEALQAQRAAAQGEESARWERVLEAGRVRSRLLRTGASVPAAHEQRWREDAAPLLERVVDHFGGRMRLATSGGATLPFEVAEFLDALGVTVLGAYGLTEHLCVAFNRPDRYVFDGVGLPMPGTELRIAEDGEVLIRRSALTFAGYWNRTDETSDAFTADGEWLLTGDLGTIDSHGFLHIIGRKKELIALSTGKKIAPLAIEARLLEDPWISQAMLYGEGRKFVSALIWLRQPVVEAWARSNGTTADGDFAALVADPVVQARVQAAVDRVNAELSNTERIKRQIVLAHELSVENGELTPTLKLRRAVVAERYYDLLDALYRATL